MDRTIYKLYKPNFERQHKLLQKSGFLFAFMCLPRVFSDRGIYQKLNEESENREERITL